jgi:prevent-host-death family protein
LTTTVNIHQAKTHFSKLIERVRLGEEIVIAKAGRPVARLVPTPAAPAGHR